jgi:uncharacterized protein
MTNRFFDDLLSNPINRIILERWDALALPDCWLVAGCLFQTVWNKQSGQPPQANIKDYDLFYFDASDLSETGEKKVQAHVEYVLADLNVTVEASNQARVHLWYESYFGYPCSALKNSCDGIDRFLIPATCVGVQPHALYAPNGLDLLYQGILTMNPLTPHRELFERKSVSYRQRWPWLQVQ